MSQRGQRRRVANAMPALRILAVLLLLLPAVVESAFAQFGRNKLQYQVFDFQIIQTAPFDIYY